MIKSMHKLDFPCKICGARADFSVVRTNDGLPLQWGNRHEAFCKDCLPDDAKKSWVVEENDPPKGFVKRYNF